MKFNHRGKDYIGYFNRERYYNNDNLAIELMLFDEQLGVFDRYTTISVNTDNPLPADCFVVKNYSECAGLPEQFPAAGYFEDTKMMCTFGFVQAPIWRVTEKFNQECNQIPEVPHVQKVRGRG